MKNKQVSTGVVQWIEDFVKGLAKNSSIDTNENEDIVATKNINDLDKVVWKDDTYRVSFDEKGANVLNEFGNTVTSVPGAKTIEDVDHKLNENEIVASDDELAQELDKIALSIAESEEDLEGQEAEETVASIEEEACDVPPVAETKEAAIVEDEEAEAPGTEEDNVINVIASGFEELEATIASLEQRLSSIEQQYARVPQLQDVSTTAPEEEVQHFTESATSSEQELNKEKSVDITTPAGRVELSKNQPTESVEQPAVETEAPVEQPTEEVKEDEPAQEATEPEVEDKDKDKEEEKAEVTEPAADVKDEDPTCDGCGKKESECDCEDCEQENKVEKLSGSAVKIFQKGICPETGEELCKSANVSGDFMGVYSPKGGTEYAIDLRSGDIFKYTR